jgi:hypothetical protein
LTAHQLLEPVAEVVARDLLVVQAAQAAQAAAAQAD